MNILDILLKELEQEAQTTRKMLACIPNDKYDWKPHQKSMDILRLANHIAELPSWIGMVLTTDELDFANNPYQAKTNSTTSDLLHYFEQTIAEGKAHLQKGREEQLTEPWTLRNGEDIYSSEPKLDVLRMAFSQIIHHRAQLGVYLRLLDIPIPGSYGPSADDLAF